MSNRPDTRPPPPHHHIQLTVTIDADNDGALARALTRLADNAKRGELSTLGGCSGSVEHGWTYTLTRDPEMTHARYFADVQSFVAARRTRRAGCD